MGRRVRREVRPEAPEGGRQARGRAGPRDGEVQGHLRRARPDLRRDVRILICHSFYYFTNQKSILICIYYHYPLQWHQQIPPKGCTYCRSLLSFREEKLVYKHTI